MIGVRYRRLCGVGSDIGDYVEWVRYRRLMWNGVTYRKLGGVGSDIGD